jgi:hypothetical protein
MGYLGKTNPRERQCSGGVADQERIDMGRIARRVPLDFEWPLNQTWEGYLTPERLHEDDCPDCANGATDAYEWLQSIAYCITGLADDAADEARGAAMHPYLTPLREVSYNHAKGRPGSQFAEFADGICSDAQGFMGRNVYRMHRALIAAAGLPEDWGMCPTCKGHGSVERYEGQRAEAEAWEPTEPPTGEGWQMWETTSEGSPVSPIFGTAEALADWLAESGASLFGSHTADAAHWLSIIKGDDFAHIEIAPGVVMM